MDTIREKLNEVEHKMLAIQQMNKEGRTPQKWISYVIKLDTLYKTLIVGILNCKIAMLNYKLDNVKLDNTKLDIMNE